jgi:hypothetical protein
MALLQTGDIHSVCRFDVRFDRTRSSTGFVGQQHGPGGIQIAAT